MMENQTFEKVFAVLKARAEKVLGRTLTDTEIAEESGGPKQPTISRNKGGKHRAVGPRPQTVLPLAAYFSRILGYTITPAMMRGEEPLPPEHPPIAGDNGTSYNAVITLTRLPVVPWNSAAKWGDYINSRATNAASLAPALPDSPRAFATIVHGDMMTAPSWPSFPAGATLIIDPDLEPLSGRFVLIDRNGDTLFRRLQIDAGRRYLVPMNARYPVDEMTDTDRIIGVVRDVTFSTLDIP